MEGKILLNRDTELSYKNFGYCFIKGPEAPPAQIYSLGWQVQDSPLYNFDGMKRPDEAGNCIFQYTLSGSGIIEINGQKHVLNKENAFITVIPSKHKYYLPKGGEKWEFIFLTLKGDYAVSEWIKLQEQFGSVLSFSEEEDIIKYLCEIYYTAVDDKLSDGYDTSYVAYEFIMKLSRALNYQSTKRSLINNSINNSIAFMKDNLNKDLSLEDIAAAVNMSKFHYNHTFTKALGISPWNYLTKLRVEYAAKLLLTTNLTVDEISIMSGYTSANYFNKVFRKYAVTSPGKRSEKYTDVKDFTLNL
jgi:AraC-like DNA-binding protein